MDKSLAQWLPGQPGHDSPGQLGGVSVSNDLEIRLRSLFIIYLCYASILSYRHHNYNHHLLFPALARVRLVSAFFFSALKISLGHQFWGDFLGIFGWSVFWRIIDHPFFCIYYQLLGKVIIVLSAWAQRYRFFGWSSFFAGCSHHRFLYMTVIICRYDQWSLIIQDFE